MSTLLTTKHIAGGLAIFAATACLAFSAGAQGLNSPTGVFEAPGATTPSRGALEILREAQRQPSLSQRFDLPRFGAPIELQSPPVFRDDTGLAPPADRPQRAERFGR